MNDVARLVVVSNRLPVTLSETDESIKVSPSSGGLVSALTPILKQCRGAWIGWPGKLDLNSDRVNNALDMFSIESGIELLSVNISNDDLDGFYSGFSNRIIWPLFHDLQSHCNFNPEYWNAYTRVIGQFCETIMHNLKPDDVLWVQDYHLFGLGQALRQAGIKNKIGFFLHIPFPSPDIFLKLPWRAELFESLGAYDLIGLQTKRDLTNFVQSAATMDFVESSRKGAKVTIKKDDVELRVGAYPISIDFAELNELSSTPAVVERAKQIRADVGVKNLILSVDRLDYTKGIPYRVRALGHLIEKSPELEGNVTLIQLVVPSREDVLEYQTLKSEIEQIVTMVNGKLGRPGWVPVQHLFRAISRQELAAFYVAADIALVTPLKDGMNLVAKEYCAAQYDNLGSLILSEFAGAAEQLGEGAELVNPYDVEGVSSALYRAINASNELKTEKMLMLRESIRNADVFAWASAFLADIDNTETFSASSLQQLWEKLRQMVPSFETKKVNEPTIFEQLFAPN